MFRLNPFKKNKPSGKDTGFFRAGSCQKGELIKNNLEIIIGDILVRIVRCTTSQPQNELTAIIPRAEIRRRRYKNGKLVAEEEIILSSITLVDAPRHPPEKKEAPTGGQAPPLPPLPGAFG